MHRFRVKAILDPQTLSRVAGAFAQRAIVPSAMRMRVVHGYMRVEVDVPELDDACAERMAAKLDESFAVIDVRLERGMMEA